MTQLPTQDVMNGFVGDYALLDEEGVGPVLNCVAAHYLDDNLIVRRAAGMIIQHRPDLAVATEAILSRAGIGPSAPPD